MVKGKKRRSASKSTSEDFGKVEFDKAIIKEQFALAEELKTLQLNYENRTLDKRTRGYITGRISSAENCWKSFRENHCQILSNVPTSDEKVLEYISQNEFSKTEEIYSNYLGELRDALETLSLTTHYNGPTPLPNGIHHTHNVEESPFLVDASSCVKLPRINIPKFSGSYRNWRSFYDLFGTLIHNNPQVPKVQKLYFLKSSLEGEALRLIRHLDIVERNYETAWELLINRYDNKRIIVNSLLKALTNQSLIKHESAEALKQFLDSTNECIHSLRNVGIDVDTWDPMLIFLLVQKLPTETRELWETSLESSRELPSLEQLTRFLESRFRTLEMIKSVNTKQHGESHNYKQRNETRSFHVEQSYTCPMCKGSHALRQCQRFLRLNVSARKEFVTNKSLCLNCLALSHHTKACNSPRSCYYCQQRHNTLLHEATKKEFSTPHIPQFPAVSVSDTQPENKVTSFYTEKVESSNSLLATALVQVQTVLGTYTLRAFIDPGSEGSFITEAAVKKLQLRRDRTSARIIGVNTSEAGTATSKVYLKIKSLHNKDFEANVSAFVLKSITSFLPSQRIAVSDWQHLREVPLADPTFHTPGHIDILLGVEVYPHILRDGIIKNDQLCPTAQNTYLGWILFGEFANDKTRQRSSEPSVSVFHNCVKDDLLRMFWELEEIADEKTFTKEEKECEEFFANTHRRLHNGRYEVCLPFTSNEIPLLGKSRNAAVSRLQQTERRLIKDPDLYEEYSKCLNEYSHLEHMRKAPTSENNHEVFSQGMERLYTVNYLPHHAVLKESTTTRLRVVFDASHQTTNGLSLNDTLHIGPKLQDDLTSIVMRWRKHRIVYTADITKMYRQIGVAEKYLPYQRILWRNSPEENIQEYELTTVTFGTSCAPYLAIRTLRQLAEDEKQNFPLAYPIVMNDFYVDDVMSGAEDFSTALKGQQQLSDMLTAGGFELHKWTSNCPELIKAIPEQKREIRLPLSFEEDDVIKTLGLRWHPGKDVFGFKISTKPTAVTLSKRALLSEIARLFDPVGWIAPSIILAKILMQKLWLAGVSWDAPIPGNIAHDWHKLRAELPLLENLEIPRWLNITSSTRVQLHGFCDASMMAYCAIVYVRSEDDNGAVQIHLLASKTKVAPVKPVSLPRLELCGALLLAKLMHQMQKALKFTDIEVHAWSDSQITLVWIRNKPNKWKMFVCNRVAAIQERVDSNHWHHVESKQNPADCGSRGLLPSDLIKSNLWWKGPQWLKSPQESWPVSKSTQQETKEELKIHKVYSIQTHNPLEILHRYSSIDRLIRISALCFRFGKNCKCLKEDREHDFVKAYEFRHALNSWLKIMQTLHFEREIDDLKNNRPLSKKSHLLSLNPFLCDKGLLRVGGRLENSTLSFNEKHPVILSSKNHLTHLIIEQAHKTTLHGGPQLMATHLRRNYWIINSRNIIRKVVHNCRKCFTYRAQSANQLMGNLPRPRIRISRPFTHTGIDYAGPILIRTSKGRGVKASKGYIAVFVCLCTKAIHLEAVSDQTTQAFLAALRRFIARRGICSHIYSDCGTNFVGASKVLKKEFASNIHSNEQKAAASLAAQNVEWHFIPPASPHFGGLWEAGVKAMKHHLRRVLAETSLTFEEFMTVLTQIEASLNSRPLCPLSNDTLDLSVLTPGHFLIGDSLLAPPEPDLVDFNKHHLTRWQYLQQLSQQFWKHWSGDYLSHLQKRPKWLVKRKNLEIGNLVLIKDERQPPRQWLLGRVMNLFPGQDGIVRVAEVKTVNGIFKRPITKLCLLPVEDGYENQTN